MTEHDIVIPAGSAARLRLAYSQFTQLAEVIAEALGISPTEPHRLDLERGVFVREASPNGQVSPMDEELEVRS